MKRNIKHIVETGPAMVGNASIAGGNTLKDVRILGWVSRNNRVYPKNIVQEALSKYEGAPVNIDHPDRDGPRKYEARFGRVHNVRMEDDGLYGDLTFNPEHPLAPSFVWWAQNDPKNIGLSHNCRAKTKWDKSGYETITSIEAVDSVDVVSEPGSTNGLFEHYNRNLENRTMPQDKEEDLVRKLDKGQQIKMEEEDEDKDKKHDDEKKEESSSMDFFEDKDKGGDKPAEKPDSLAGYVAHLKEKFMEVVGDEDKTMKLIDLLDLKDEASCDDGMREGESNDPMDSKKDDNIDGHDDDPKKAEESLRQLNQPGVKRLLEELDSYRVKARRDELTVKAKELCSKSGLPAYSITETFMDTLIGSEESGWKRLVEDRKKVLFHTKSPISTTVPEQKLTVSELVKRLTQE